MLKVSLKNLFLVSCFVFLSGCAIENLDNAIKEHRKLSENVKLGDSINEVKKVLSPCLANVEPQYLKKPESYMDGEKRVDILFYRSARQPDGMLTDDELTPYIFHDETLVGIGWSMLGGPKTQGKASQGPIFIPNLAVPPPPQPIIIW